MNQTTSSSSMDPVPDTDLDAPPSTPRPLTAEDRRAIAHLKAMYAMAERKVDGFTFAQLLRAEGSAVGLTMEEEIGVFERVAARIKRGEVEVNEEGEAITTEEALARLAALQERFAPEPPAESSAAA